MPVKVDAIKNTLDNDERKVGAEIVRRSLGYPLKLIANNAGVNGSVVQQKVLESSDPNVGYNASTGGQLGIALWTISADGDAHTPCVHSMSHIPFRSHAT